MIRKVYKLIIKNEGYKPRFINHFKWVYITAVFCMSISCTTTIIDEQEKESNINPSYTSDSSKEQIIINAYPDTKGFVTFNVKAEQITINWGDGDTETLDAKGDETVLTHQFFNNKIQKITVKAKKMTECFFYGSGDLFTGFTELKFTDCLNLTLITASAQLLTAIDINNAPVLKKLKIAAALKSVDFINNLPALEKLQLTTDLESVSIKNQSLKEFNYWASDTQFKSDKLKYLDVSNCSALEILDCDRPKLSVLNIDGCTNLQTINCVGTSLSALDVSQCKKLKVLNCTANRLTSLNLTNNIALENLVCQQNYLSSIDLSNNKTLSYLHCAENQLTEISLDNNTALTYLNCANNRLNNLSVNNCLELILLTFSNNYLTYINLENNLNLTYINCKNNNISADEMNKIFLYLPKRSSKDNASILIGGNPEDETGTRNCNKSIAESKKWRVI